MGERENGPFQLCFNASLKVDFQGSRVTSDGGLILLRELDERLAFGDLIVQHLTDSRRGKNTQLSLADLLRQSMYSRIAGFWMGSSEPMIPIEEKIELRWTQRKVCFPLVRAKKLIPTQTISEQPVTPVVIEELTSGAVDHANHVGQGD